jgi:transcriptional regulatory protein RtcR
MAQRTVVLGFYGSNLDRGRGEKRWARWRPSVALCRHEDFVVDRFELVHQLRDTRGAQQVVADIAQVSPETEVRLHAVDIADPWDFEEVFGVLHGLARAYAFDPDRDRYLVHITTGTHVAQICWFLLTESRHIPGELLQTSPPGRGDQPDGPGQRRVIDLDLSRYDAIARRFRMEQAEGQAFLKSGIETRNAAFNRLIEQLERVALRSREPILLNGPTGAGKSSLARQIHALRHRKGLVGGPLVEVNCATIRGDGAMSALFGHVRGAFTGAAKDRKGLLRAANGGLLFLDEIGELGLDEQAMLLRAIEQQRFLPVGTDIEVRSDFQLIAGTNRDLKQSVSAGRFREDLLARINLWTFQLPGLADRREDIEPNLDYELARASERLGHQITINREARRHFLDFATGPTALWTANFRDFGAAILRMGTLAPSGRIDLECVDDEIRRLDTAWRADDTPDDTDLVDLLGPARLAEVDLFDQVQLQAVIRVCRRSRSLSEAGRALFAASRARRKSTNDADRLRKYLARFGLSWPDIYR